jgi:tetratricopeptide (TPR) repeat protein
MKATIERINAVRALALSKPDLALKKLADAEELNKKSEDFHCLIDNQIFTDLIRAEAYTSLEHFDDAKRVLNDAGLLVHRQPGLSRFTEIRLLELAAKLDLAQNKIVDARSNYQKAIDILTQLSVPGCPLAARLKAALEKLPTS